MNRALFAAAALWSAAAFSQTSHTPAERYRLFQDYLAQRAAEITEHNLADIRTASDWQRRRPQIRKQILYMLGLDPMPQRTALHAHVTGAFDRPQYRVEKVVFQSMPGLYVTGDLYLPKDARGPLPTVLYVCGHAPDPGGAKVSYQHHGIWLASHGYVAFLIDTIEFGEIPGIHHGTHDLNMWEWLSLGYTPAGPEVWNAIRAVDYLNTRPEVDPKRIAITGISGGGAMTWYAAAVDNRFQAAASVCATWTVEHHVALNAVVENCDCIYFPNIYQLDLPAVGALIAPRPFKILSARRDVSFPTPGYKAAFQHTLPIYRLLNAPDHIADFEADAHHEDTLAFRQGAYQWLDHWIKNDDTPYDEGTIRREAAAALRVLDGTPAEAINDDIQHRFIPVHRLQTWTTLQSWQRRKASLLAELRDKVLRVLPTAKVVFDTWKAPDGGWVNRYAEASNVEFTTERGVRVRGQLFVPRDAAKTADALIFIKRKDEVIGSIDYDRILPALGKRVVLVLYPRGVDYPLDNYQMATVKRTCALLGATLESMQLWDLLRSVDFLLEDQHLPLREIAVYGRREMGALAIYAAALEPRITRVILDDPPTSHWQGPPLLNVLRVTDLPEAAGLVAPRPVVSLTPLPAPYDYTRSIYRLFGKAQNLRAAGGLNAALR